MDERTLQKDWASAPPERKDAISAALRGQICGNIASSEGTEELAHLEIVGSIIYQLTKDLSPEEVVEKGFEKYLVDHTTGVYPQAASGAPYTAAYIQVKGDPIVDLHEDLAAEMKAKTTYDNILRISDDPDVNDAIRFLRQREIVHYQRFGELLRIVQDKLDSRNYFAINPSFDK